jgi:uncharacterized membrane protein
VFQNIPKTHAIMTSSKQIFGIILTVLGIAGLIYTAVQIIDSDSDSFKTLVVIGILGLIFFSAGIKLLRTLRDT